MRFVLFGEGNTERKGLPPFLRKSLEQSVGASVGIRVVEFTGWAEYRDEVAKKALKYLEGPGSEEIIAIIGLLDLHSPGLCPDDRRPVQDRIQWVRQTIESMVGHPKFRQYVAVHETEAWLLSDPSIFPAEIRKVLVRSAKRPETVDDQEPPSRFLSRLYVTKTPRGKAYKKVVDGSDLFEKLNPVAAQSRCPHLKEMLDDMTALAQGVISAQQPD